MIKWILKKFSKSDHGFVTVEFVAGVGLLVLPTMVLVTVFPTWSERVSMARVASREAARTFVLTKDPAQASQIVQTIQSNYTMPDNTMTLTLEGDPTLRGSKVIARVTTQIPLTAIPYLDLDKNAISVSKTHTEVVDLYRSSK